MTALRALSAAMFLAPLAVSLFAGLSAPVSLVIAALWWLADQLVARDESTTQSRINWENT